MNDQLLDRHPNERSTEKDLSPTGGDARSSQPSAEDPQRLPDGNYVGQDNIREGNVGGIIGGPHQQGGQGQGG